MATPEASSAGRIVRFGVFEVDLVSGELRKDGSRIRLQEQPFQILTMLLERRGAMVTREDLRSKLWPADTFVDFDHGLNTAVNKLREALGDAAANPRFVQTVARRGYRFIAPIQENGRPPASQSTMTPADKTAEVPVYADLALHPDLAVPIPQRGLTRGLFLLIQAMYLIFYIEALLHWPDVHRIAGSFLPGWGAVAILVAVVGTAWVGILLGCFLVSAVLLLASYSGV